MTLADAGSTGGAVAAFLALFVSVVALRKSNAFAQRQVELSETTDRLSRLLIERDAAESIASRKADLAAEIVRSKPTSRLRIFNRGQAVARNVRLIDMMEPGQTILIPNDLAHRFPLPILDSGQSVEATVFYQMSSPSYAHIKLLWDDETGSGHEKELTPSL